MREAGAMIQSSGRSVVIANAKSQAVARAHVSWPGRLAGVCWAVGHAALVATLKSLLSYYGSASHWARAKDPTNLHQARGSITGG